MSLHGNPVLLTAKLPDGREARIRVGVAEDPYIAEREIDTVSLEVRVGDEVAAVLDTVLGADQVREAHELGSSVADGLSSGAREPTADSLEPLADQLR